MSTQGVDQDPRVAQDFLWGVPMLAVGLLLGGFGVLEVVVDTVANVGYGGSGVLLSAAAIVALLLGALVAVPGLAIVTNALYRTVQLVERLSALLLGGRPVTPDVITEAPDTD